MTTAIPAGSYEAQGRDQRELGRELRRRAACRAAPTSRSPCRRTARRSTFSYDSATHVLTITSSRRGHAHDNNVEWDGLRHDSRDTLYRTPGGAVPAGTPVTLRFRTFHDDVTAVGRALLQRPHAAAQQIVADDASPRPTCRATRRASTASSCDFWQVDAADALAASRTTSGTASSSPTAPTPTTTPTTPRPSTAASAQPTDDAVDQSWALMQSTSRASRAPAWAKDAVIYQIFPDRFRNGRKDNDPKTGDIRYDDPVLKLAWNVLPEGYCRNYADGATTARGASTHAARRQPDEGAAARPRLLGRRPQGRRPAARLPAVAGRQRDLLQPDLRRRLQPLATTPRTTRRSTRTSARRRTSTTSSSTPRRSGSA